MAPPSRVRRLSDARSFLARAGSWLLEREAENTLPLGIARRLAEGQRPYEPPLYFAVVEGPGGVEGCALRTPPWPLLVTELPPASLVPLAEDVARVYEELPAVSGPDETAAALARAWAGPRGLGVTAGMRQRLFQLDRLVPPARPAPGRLRFAAAGDRERLASWLVAFGREANIRVPDGEAAADDLISRRAAVVWEEEGEPRSLAAISGETPHTARIGYVYTPPEERGRGYATACVAALSRRLLEGGCESVVLFTDLSNPTSNAIYQRLGYRPIGDVTQWSLETGEPWDEGEEE
jgi:predicted GNAT family acetyltransferase